MQRRHIEPPKAENVLALGHGGPPLVWSAGLAIKALKMIIQDPDQLAVDIPSATWMTYSAAAQQRRRCIDAKRFGRKHNVLV
ncbi:hypothetical protein PI125_g15695 [Phytophthora idaei]|nr:hypothetical protein PI125_g15695 [Phytophthora idaei]